MQRFQFRVYYQYRGPSLDDPFAKKKSPEEIANALDRVREELPVLLPTPDCSVEVEHAPEAGDSVTIVIKSSADEAEVLAATKRCLCSLGLFGERIPI